METEKFFLSDDGSLSDENEKHEETVSLNFPDQIDQANPRNSELVCPTYTLLQKRSQMIIDQSNIDQDCEDDILKNLFVREMFQPGSRFYSKYQKYDLPVKLHKGLSSFLIENEVGIYQKFNILEKKIYVKFLKAYLGSRRCKEETEDQSSVLSLSSVKKLVQGLSKRSTNDILKYLIKSFMSYIMDNIIKRELPCFENKPELKLKLTITFLENNFRDECQTENGKIKVISTFVQYNKNLHYQKYFEGFDLKRLDKGYFRYSQQMKMIKSNSNVKASFLNFLDLNKNKKVTHWFKSEISQSIDNYIKKLYRAFEQYREKYKENYLKFCVKFKKKKKIQY